MSNQPHRARYAHLNADKLTYPRHPAECHKCPYNAIAANAQNETPERLAECRMACEGCNGGRGACEDSKRGLNIVYLGSFEAPEAFLHSRIDAAALPVNRARGQKLTNAPAEVENAAFELIQAFSSMSKTSAIAFWALLSGNARTSAEAAAVAGCSRQNFYKSMLRLLKQFPFLYSLIPEKGRQHKSIESYADCFEHEKAREKRYRDPLYKKVRK